MTDSTSIARLDEDGPPFELRQLARAQCTDEQLVAVCVCVLEQPRAMAEQLVERWADRLELERHTGQAQLLGTQWRLALEHPLSPGGQAMLHHLGVQYLAQVPGGPDREVLRLLKRWRSLPADKQAAFLQGAARRITGGGGRDA